MRRTLIDCAMAVGLGLLLVGSAGCCMFKGNDAPAPPVEETGVTSQLDDGVWEARVGGMKVGIGNAVGDKETWIVKPGTAFPFQVSVRFVWQSNPMPVADFCAANQNTWTGEKYWCVQHTYTAVAKCTDCPQ